MKRSFVPISLLIVLFLLWLAPGYTQVDPTLLGRIEALENTMTTLQTTLVEDQRTTVETLKNNLSSAQALMDSMVEVRSTIADLQATLAEVQVIKDQIAEVQSTLATLQADLAAVQARKTGLTKDQRDTLADLKDKLAAIKTLSTLTPFISVEKRTINGLKGPHVLLTGVNVHIRSSSGKTHDGKSLMGLGNLVIGFNEEPSSPKYNPQIDRRGSHNLIIGEKHRYSSYGGLVAGSRNTIRKPGASVIAGTSNTANGDYASVTGGSGNVASGSAASVSGGQNNVVDGQSSSVSGGFNLQVTSNFDWRAGTPSRD